jgi:hypothetical protein
VRDLIHNDRMQLSWLAWVGTVIALATGVKFLAAHARRAPGTADLGFISAQWIAEYRAASYDPNR